MKKLLRIAVLFLIAGVGACERGDDSAATVNAPTETKTVIQTPPPLAATHSHEVASPHGSRSDPYYWMRDDARESPAVLEYLTAENEYYERSTEHLGALTEAINEEILGRIKQDDSTVPVFENGYWYYVRFEDGKEYPIYARRKATLEAAEEVLLDSNALATGHDFYQIGSYEVSPDNRLLAWTDDTVGRRQWTLRVKVLADNTVSGTEIPNVEGSFAWANDNSTLLYIEKDLETLLGYKVRKHVLGTEVADDPLVYEEDDRSFYMGVGKSRSGRFLTIVVQSTVSTEYRVADANDPTLTFNVVIPRERDHEYSLEDHGDDWIIRSNRDAPNFRVVRAPMASAADVTTWRDVVAHRNDAFIDDAVVFDDYLAIEERSAGLRNLRIQQWSDAQSHQIASDESTYSMWLSSNPEPSTRTLRYQYSSLTTPTSTFDYTMDARKQTLLKRDPVLGGFDPANYRSEFLMVLARDGVTRIPVSLLYRRDYAKNGKAPLYQYAYGSYGSSSDPTFSSARLSLVDRGFVYAIAHIRGGQEMGRQWYDDGRLLNKKNTFNDFIDVTRFLVADRYVAEDRVSAMGGSAGGLLMGAIANMAPQDYSVIAAHVPFVDVVTTMLDESIPLTTNEFDEWGNPKEKVYYDYMMSYSPYDNVSAQNYPAIYVTTGLWDSQVQYWEPAKWVARLRATKTDDRLLVFKTNMEAGHGGRSGRFQRLREVAQEYAFIVDQLAAPTAPLAWPPAEKSAP